MNSLDPKWGIEGIEKARFGGEKEREGACGHSFCCKSVYNTVLNLNFKYSQERNEVKTVQQLYR